MNNLISLFMNYKIQRLVEYGIFLLDDDSPFLRKVLKEYLSVYVDNYYYNIFYTIDDNSYNEDNLKKEFQGIMEEMLQDYRQYELEVSNEEYASNVHFIHTLKDFSLELLKIDSLQIPSKEEANAVVEEFVNNNEFFREKVNTRINKFIKLVKDTFSTNNKLFNHSDHYFEVISRSFVEMPDVSYLELQHNIHILHSYRKSMVARVYLKEELEKKKMECMIQKVSLRILKGIIEKKDISTFIVPLSDYFIKRGKIDDDIFDLIDNPLFRHYVYFGVSYNIYTSQKNAFSENFHFACIQDFSHINDVYQKVENISKEGTFDYLVISDYKYKDRDFFLGYEGAAMKILIFEEE